MSHISCMSPSEFAASLRAIADAVEQYRLPTPSRPPPAFDGEVAWGGILALQHLRKLVTNSQRRLTNTEFLVLIDALGHCQDMFPPGLWEVGDGVEEYVRRMTET